MIRKKHKEEVEVLGIIKVFSLNRTILQKNIVSKVHVSIGKTEMSHTNWRW